MISTPCIIHTDKNRFNFFNSFILLINMLKTKKKVEDKNF